MSSEKVDHPTVELMTRNRWSGADAPAYDVQAGHLLCAACVRGGCDSPPCGRAVADALLDVLRAHPRLMLRIRTDLDLARTHYLDVYENRRTESLPADFERRSANFIERCKDLEICRNLGTCPNSTIPALVSVWRRIRVDSMIDNMPMDFAY